jgi:flagellar motor switch protein FliN
MSTPSPVKHNEPALGPEHDTPSAQVVSLREPPAAEAGGPRLLDGNLGLISGVKVRLEVVVGDAELTVAELFALQKGSVVPLEQLYHAPLTVRLDGKAVAHGTLVVVGDNFGVRITDIAATPVAAA